MGVKGLYSYIHSICPQECFPEVSILDLMKKHCKNSRSATRQELVINGDSIVYLLSENLDWACGGQFKLYLEKLERFVGTLYDKGIMPVFFFSGGPVSSRIEYRLRKFEERRKHIVHIFERMCQDKERDQKLLDWDIIPPTMKPLTPFFLKHQLSKKCQVNISLENVDAEINLYARTNRCLAIMSDDTDNIIFPASCIYLSANKLNVSKMTTVAYNRHAIAVHIGLKSVDQLPLFATLVGNEIVDRNDLFEFHAGLCPPKFSAVKPGAKKQTRFLHSMFPRNILFPQVAEVVQAFPPWPAVMSCLDDIASRLLKDDKVENSLRLSILSYMDPKSQVTDLNNNYTYSAPHLQSAKLLHTSCINPPMIFSVLSGGTVVCPPVLEDLTLQYYQSANLLLRPLRAKIYGILLCDRSQDQQLVLEYCAYNQKNLKNVEVVCAELPQQNLYPGLEELWDQSVNSEDMMSIRWELFTSTISQRLSPWIFDLGAVPKQMIIPVATLFYLQDRCQLYHWEVAALIATFVLLPHYSSEFIDTLFIPTPLDSRSVSLASTISLTIFTVITTYAACGYPSGHFDIAGEVYFDGKLFQNKYAEAKYNRKLFTIGEQQQQSQFLDIFHMVYGYYYEC
ncbi:unnamed protein product [Bemisia tabaci]|uniref:Constitutive coactivator of peroxisome proliferator-activated receptor gamma n=1 Tax=Bemisia tabaci TaxID=7038 RepID=A0A9P0F1G7_BEMTA|nr:unnamed protein product [Bemisia tabaci]